MNKHSKADYIVAGSMVLIGILSALLLNYLSMLYQ